MMDDASSLAVVPEIGAIEEYAMLVKSNARSEADWRQAWLLMVRSVSMAEVESVARALAASPVGTLNANEIDRAIQGAFS
jgi:hypothetical protein